MVTAALITGLVAALLFLITQPFTSRLPSNPPEVDPARLQAHVRYLSVELYPRSFEQFDKMERAAQYILGEFRSAGAAVELQEVAAEESTYRNVIARFGPTDDPVLVIGAHYDSHGDANWGARFERGYDLTTHTPGADDNASGVAGLIELAYLLQQNPPTRPVELVAYALEEPPYFRTGQMGSARHARSLREAGREVRLMLALEMIGFFTDEAESQGFPVPGMGLLYPDRGNFIALVGRLGDFGLMRRTKGIMAGATGLPVHSINAPAIVPGIDLSDHLSYWRQGYPALMVTDTAFYRNRNYHRAGDTYDRLDYGRMAQVVRAVYAVVQADEGR